jgi:hypothetical protein
MYPGVVPAEVRQEIHYQRLDSHWIGMVGS